MFIITILIAVVLYLVKNHFDKIFLEPGKQWLITEIDENWEDHFKFVIDNAEKDSLKILLKYFVDNFESTDEITSEATENVLNFLETALSDSIITNNELGYLTKIVMRDKDEEQQSN